MHRKAFSFSMDIYQQKKELRKQVKQLKATFSLEQKKALSMDIIQQIEKAEVFNKARCIMAYWSMDDEVFTHEFVKKWGGKKQIVLPVVKGSELELKVFRGVEELVAGENFGIPEPAGELFEDAEQIELIIVPGVAFDKDKNRMGRGKAYYDQLLRNSKAYKMGICFHFQYFNQVPHDHLDVQMDEVLINTKEAD